MVIELKKGLITKDLRKTFGGLVALESVDIEVEKGLMTMLIGPNGSGKTTLINVIAGFYKPDKGSVWYNGREITGLPPHRLYEMGIVRTFQIPQPFLKLTVLENLMTAFRGNPGEGFFRALIKNSWLKKEESASEQAFELLRILNLDHLWNEESQKLSGGQTKLLEVGRALMCGAELLLMDEPAAGINPVLAHEVFDHLKEIGQKLGITFLVVEHRLDVALKYVDYVYAMARGTIISKGEGDEVLNDPAVIESYLGR